MRGDREPPRGPSSLPRIEAWVDQKTPDMLRPYMVAGGRTEPQHDLRIDTMLTAADGPSANGGLHPEHRRVLRLCGDTSRPLGEVASLLRLPLLTTKIIVGDMIDCGTLAAPRTGAVTSPISEHLVRKTLDGIRRLKAS